MTTTDRPGMCAYPPGPAHRPAPATAAPTEARLRAALHGVTPTDRALRGTPWRPLPPAVMAAETRSGAGAWDWTRKPAQTLSADHRSSQAVPDTAQTADTAAEQAKPAADDWAHPTIRRLDPDHPTARWLIEEPAATRRCRICGRRMLLWRWRWAHRRCITKRPAGLDSLPVPPPRTSRGNSTPDFDG